MTERPKSISPADAKAGLASGSCIIVDIRNPDEFARQRIPGARLVPAGELSPAVLSQERASGKTVVFHCRSGARTDANAARIAALGLAEPRILAGGLDAWARCGFETEGETDAPLEIMRQVQIAVGLLVLASVLLGAAASPWFLLLAAFAGAGLLLAGLTGFCGMARLLTVMPWNARPVS